MLALSIIQLLVGIAGLMLTFYHLFRGFIQKQEASKAKAAKYFFGMILIILIISLIQWAMVLI